MSATAPLVDFYRKQGLLVEVNGDRPPNEVLDHITSLIAG
jgi:adenylate kinase family enzyme